MERIWREREAGAREALEGMGETAAIRDVVGCCCCTSAGAAVDEEEGRALSAAWEEAQQPYERAIQY